MNNIAILSISITCISLFVVGIPVIYGVLLPIIKPKLNQKSITYLYAFSAGFFTILSTVGFIGETKHELDSYFSKFSTPIRGLIISSIIGGTLLVCLGLSLIIKIFLAKKTALANINSTNEHEHDLMIFNISDYNPKLKKLALFLLLTHRIPGGLILGFLSSSIVDQSGNLSIDNIIFLLIFIIHIIPEELIMYYRQIEMGISRWIAVRNSIFATMILIPLMIIGGSIGLGFSSLWKEIFNDIILNLIKLMAASFLLFTALIEFLPELLHYKLSAKEWYLTILWLILGIIFSIIVISFHVH